GGRGRRLARARTRFLTGSVLRRRLARFARLQDPQRWPGLAFDRADPERHPLRRGLEAGGFRIAPRMRRLEASGLDPHLLALQQPVDAGLAWLRPGVLARRAGRLVV